ncbi:MAG: hypothetical protein KA603_00145 [Azonexus sp.]|nr:transcriptional regulator [Betaproteobacteria bacterium]MBK8918599.1 transcriptional regulator [Betaproteobacteria bacterium]MBP6034531.1 hypothetical protein [Azonexus sp.]MBP6905071.1 hypothetical protein [Azonexus sp.]
MLVPIPSPQELGLVLRATRKAQGLRLDDLAGSASVGHVFAREAEHGKETLQLGKVLALLVELGIRLQADMPDTAIEELLRLRQTGLRPLKRQRLKQATPKHKGTPKPPVKP